MIRKPSPKNTGNLRSVAVQRSRGNGPRISFPWKSGLRILGGLGAVGLFLATGLGIWQWMTHCDLFRLNKVQINGCQHMTREEVLQLSGVTARANLLTLDLAQVAKRIEAHPWIHTAALQRQFPDHLVITVAEHRPVAILKGKKAFLLADTGVIFKEAGADEAGSLPVITGIDPEATRGGKLPEPARRALDLIAMAGTGTRTLGLNNLGEIDLMPDGGLVVRTADRSLPIHFDQGPLSTQFARAEKILFQLYRSGMYETVAEVKLDYGPGRAWAKLKTR